MRTIAGPLVDWKEKGDRFLCRNGRRGGDGGIQAKGRAQERRRQFCLSRSGPFPRYPDSESKSGARRTDGSGNRSGRLRENQWRISALLDRIRSEELA